MNASSLPGAIASRRVALQPVSVRPGSQWNQTKPRSERLGELARLAHRVEEAPKRSAPEADQEIGGVAPPSR